MSIVPPQEAEKNLSNNATGGDNQEGVSNTPKILSLSIKDLKVLYTAFMPFISQGGLFIPTKKSFNMGDILPLMISLMDENIKYSVNGKVIWITPNNVHNRTPGIGVQFVGENADKLYKKITNMLDKYSSNKEPTNTM